MKFSPVPPSMPLEALSVRLLEIHSAFNDIDEGPEGNFIIFNRHNVFLHTCSTNYR